MKSVTAQQLVKLKDRARVIYLLSFNVGGQDYYYTNTDHTYTYNGNVYLQGVLQDFDEIETTSEPRTNDVEFSLFDPDLLLSAIFLNDPYMNKQCSIIEVILDSNGEEILTETVFEGFISEAVVRFEMNMVTPVVSSIFADFEKESGTRTNPNSQQRWYPNDTAFEHSVKAKEKLYWGKDAPSIILNLPINDFSRYDPPSVVIQ